MKIGTLTFHDTTNYGAVLQAYALQNCIESFGVECEIIDYENEVIKKRYEIKKIRDCRNIKEIIKAILTNGIKKKIKKSFRYFSTEKLKVSMTKYNRCNISNANDIYDKFFVGSDQVWNLSLTGDDTTYMLDFVTDNKKKYSYAASFGYSNVPQKYIESTKKYISKFNNILVREEQGKKIINEIINKTADVTLDPTLLLNKQEWEKIQSNKIKDDEEYILLYIIAPNKDIINFAKKLAKKEKCKIIYINHSLKLILGIENKRKVSPEEFLEYINKAKYVVTTSFHGVAFSINYEKQFFYALSSEKNNFNSRVENLIMKMNIKNRCITDGVDNNVIDYDSVKKILMSERKKSIELLKNEVNG